MKIAVCSLDMNRTDLQEALEAAYRRGDDWLWKWFINWLHNGPPKPEEMIPPPEKNDYGDFY